MKAPIFSARQYFDQFFGRELLKSEHRRSSIYLVILTVGFVLGWGVLILGEAHFVAMGDTSGKRFWMLGVVALTFLYHLLGRQVLKRRIDNDSKDAGNLTLLTVLAEPSFVTLLLVLECLIFKPGMMFESPLTLAYPLVIFLSCLQLSWRLCLLSSLVSAGQYLLLVAWYWTTLSSKMPQPVSSYLPEHGMRAFVLLLCGAAAAFVAYEIRRGLTSALQHLEERDHVVNVFGRYLSDDVADAILRSPEGLQLGGKRRTVTVMMTDLRGFTSLSESLPPEDVIAMLNNCLATLTEVVQRYKGTIDEFIGDAILALFGAPFAEADDAARAVACAVEMQLAMERVNQWNAEHGYPQLEMGIGIHTGPVVVGNIGSEQRSKYGVVGSNVNLTSRIESYTVGGQILISGQTAAAAGPDLQLRGRRTIQPKGFSDPIEICEVGGIGGRFNVFLPETQERFRPLNPPVSVRFKVLAGKDASGPYHEGQLVALSERGARLISPTALAALSNLKLEPEGQSDSLAAKVLEVGAEGSLLRFSGSLPETLQALLE